MAEKVAANDADAEADRRQKTFSHSQSVNQLQQQQQQQPVSTGVPPIIAAQTTRCLVKVRQ